MALTPISMFQPQGSGIAQFLQGGQNALAAALNNVVQVGRDTANKQFAQERDFLGEQKRVEDLAQRRGEVAQQQGNFERTFARNLFVSDRDFADRNADQARQEERMRAQDLFNQKESNRNYDLRKSEADLRMDVFEEQQRTRDEQEQFEKDILAQDGVLPQKPSLTAEFLYGPVGKKGVDVTVAASTPEERLAEATIRMEAAKGKDAKIFTEAAREKAKAEAEIKASGGDVSASEMRSQERLEMARRSEERTLGKAAEAKAEKARDEERKIANSQIEGLLTDFKAFPPAQSFVPADLTKDEKEAAMAQAEATDTNRATIEVQAALDSPTFDDYLIKTVASAEQKDGKWRELSREEKLAKAKALGPEVIKKRRKLYELARKTSLAGTPSAASASPVASEIERLRSRANQLAD